MADCTDARKLPKTYQKAVYHPQRVPAYQGNPFLEALPPIVGERDDIRSLLSHPVRVLPEQRQWSSGERAHLLTSLLKQYRYPLERNVTFFADVDTVLRAAYIGRNPVDPDFVARLPRRKEQADSALFRNLPILKKYGAVDCRGVLGHSGLGKSTMVGQALDLYPRTILHTGLHGPLSVIDQVVWLEIECPSDGSLRGLCLAILAGLDAILCTNYSEDYGDRGTVDSMTIDIARLAGFHGIGLLVIENIQHLAAARKSDKARMLNFFKLLSDVTRVSLLTIGTEDAQHILGGDFQNARRNSGCYMLKPLEMPEFMMFLKGLLGAVVLRNRTSVDREFAEFLWKASFGIHALVTNFFKACQVCALALGKEELSVELLHHTYDKCGNDLIKPYLDHMRQEGRVAEPVQARAIASTDGTRSEAQKRDQKATNNETKRHKRPKADPNDRDYALLAPNLDVAEVLERLGEQGAIADLTPRSVAA